MHITEREKLVKFRQTIQSQFGCQLPVILICRQLAQRAGLRIGAFDDKAALQEFELGAQKRTLIYVYESR